MSRVKGFFKVGGSPGDSPGDFNQTEIVRIDLDSFLKNGIIN